MWAQSSKSKLNKYFHTSFIYCHLGLSRSHGTIWFEHSVNLCEFICYVLAMIWIIKRETFTNQGSRIRSGLCPESPFYTCSTQQDTVVVRRSHSLEIARLVWASGDTCRARRRHDATWEVRCGNHRVCLQHIDVAPVSLQKHHSHTYSLVTSPCAILCSPYSHMGSIEHYSDLASESWLSGVRERSGTPSF